MGLFLSKTIYWVFQIYTLVLVGRIIGSWFPKYFFHPLMRFARMVADPYLNVFRRVIPPIGGTLDLSPMLAFFALQMIERTILGILNGLR